MYQTLVNLINLNKAVSEKDLNKAASTIRFRKTYNSRNQKILMLFQDIKTINLLKLE